MGLINTKGCEILGYKESEIIGKNWFDNFLPQKDREQTKIVFSDLIAGRGEEVEYYENPVLTKDNRQRLIAWHNSILRDNGGKIIVVLGSGEDITDQRELQEEVLKARKLESLGILAGGIAHDLNNLLFAVMGNIYLAQDDLRPETGTSESLKKAQKACVRAKELSARLITFSKGGDPVRKRNIKRQP